MKVDEFVLLQSWRKSNIGLWFDSCFWKRCEEIKEKLHAVYKDNALSMTTIRYWYNEFKRDRTSIFDEERPGRSIKVTTEDMVNKIHDIVLAVRRVKIKEIANIVKISTERIQNVLHETLGMKKLSARWVPCLLTVEQTKSHDNFKALFGHV